MNDPHVAKLYYKLVPGKNVDYENAPSISAGNDLFDITVTKEMVVFSMKSHYPTAIEAKAAVEPYLDSWRILIGIEQDPDDLEFRFINAEIIDRFPSIERGHKTINLHASMHAISSTSPLNS